MVRRALLFGQLYRSPRVSRADNTPRVENRQDDVGALLAELSRGPLDMPDNIRVFGVNS